MLARLLLIEDEAEIRTMLKLALEDEGYVVHEAADGASGLAAFHEHEPDLVLLDLRLPDRRGLDVCRDLRRESIVPIIIVTAWFAGAIYLGFVAALPTILISQTSANFFFGGTSILIVVGVALDTVKQLEAQLMMRNYEGFLK